jgi:hypothetical protein
MLEFSAEHGIEAIVEVMPFSRVNDAIERVRRRDVVGGWCWRTTYRIELMSVRRITGVPPRRSMHESLTTHPHR